MYKENNSRLHEKLKVSSAEIAKGNSIIHKLQSDARSLRSKLRLKAAVLLQQQEDRLRRCDGRVLSSSNGEEKGGKTGQ